MNDPQVQPARDPGNSRPEEWTKDLDPEEMKEIVERLQRESGDS